ncbi:MAG TPA: GDP-mannose 4,6-dehydratase [Candidatus Acidoferrales bacterium]|nr:GDP-mannose 4,6-dehydratase [Candidatus Acidoferrales bacterium]
MRFLITGITGFAGRHLTARVLADGHDVFGMLHRPGSDDAAGRLGLPSERLFVAALHDKARLAEVVRQVRPDGVFHLAAFTNPSASFVDPGQAYRSNLLGSLNIFAAVRAGAAACRLVWVGSSDAYGQVYAHELPVTESNPFRPLSPYAVSKAAADLAGYQWSRAQGLDVVRLRPFNHTGPGQAADFVCSDFARQVVAVERGEQAPRIAVGNLDVARDFSDVRDVVSAYVLAWERGHAGEAYNVCSGTARTPGEILAQLLRLSGIRAELDVQRTRLRPVDVPTLVGSAAALRAATDWSPQFTWEQTLRDLLDDWRRQFS